MNLTAQSTSSQNQQPQTLAFPQTPEPSKEQFGNTYFAQPYNLDAAGINQANLEQWFDDLEYLDDTEKAALFAILSLGYNLDQAIEKIEGATLYRGRLEDAAEELFDEIYLSEIPKNLHSYIDYSRFARDCELSGDMTEFEFAGETWTLTNASSL